MSPVFLMKEALRGWLIAQGHSEKSADAFIDGGSAPSMVVSGGMVLMGIDSLDIL